MPACLLHCIFKGNEKWGLYDIKTSTTQFTRNVEAANKNSNLCIQKIVLISMWEITMYCTVLSMWRFCRMENYHN